MPPGGAFNIVRADAAWSGCAVQQDENIQTQYGELSLLNEETGKMQANMNGLSLAMPGSALS